MMKKNVQGPKAKKVEEVGTVGWPKDNENIVHGYGESIVENSTRRDLEYVSVKALAQPTIGARLKALHELSKKHTLNSSLRFQHVIHLISHEDTLKLAYELIKSNPGNMTSGPIKGVTLDGMSLEKLSKMSSDLKMGTYKFSPARRIWIPKPSKQGERPLGIASPPEKIVQKAIQLVLQEIWEPLFLPSSHGFRPGKGTHTALKQIKINFKGVAWVIEADISKCFDRIDHSILMEILANKIACDKTLSLMKKALKAGYIDGSTYSGAHAAVGTPQGSILSPLLCNIYMHELDIFMEEYMKEVSGPHTRRKANPEYSRVSRQLRIAATRDERKKLSKLRRTIPSKDSQDPNFMKGVYIRYADDFVVGIIGPKSLAQTVSDKIREFLKDKLKLDINEAKTHLTPFRSNPIRFLWTDISEITPKEKKVATRSTDNAKIRVNASVKLKVPMDKLLKNLVEKGFIFYEPSKKCYSGRVRTTHVNLDHADILSYYSSVIRGTMNYYSFVDNRASLMKIVHLLKDSCARTFARKYKLSSRLKVYKKFGKKLMCPETKTELFLPSDYARTGKFYINPTPPQLTIAKTWDSKLTRSHLGKTCLLCEKASTEMHHVRSIRSLRSKLQTKPMDFFTTQMSAINRKQVPLCKEHHLKVHASGDKGFTPEEKAQIMLRIGEYGNQPSKKII